MRGLRWVLAIVPIVVGCGGSDKPFEARPPVADEEELKSWLRISSALSVYFNFHEPIAVADGQQSFQDPACPVTTDDGTTLVITGGCTDVSGRSFGGRATVVRNGGERTITLEDWLGASGTVVVREIGPSLNEFRAELSPGYVTFIEYDGLVEGEYTGRSTWNGSGRIEDSSPTKIVEVATVDEVLDRDVCPQPLTGATTIHLGDDTAVITYDGATDCDEMENARLTVNGDDRGLVPGFYCALAAPGKRDRAGGVGVSLALAALFCVRRRPAR